MRMLLIFPIMCLAGIAAAQDAVEAAASCVVIHEPSEADGEKIVTCFENVSLERTSFESGVCQWKTESQAATKVQTTTQFVPHCPTTYRAFCDVLVMGPQAVAPVKIFLYDRSDDVLERARKQCLSGGGIWHPKEAETE